MFSAFSTNRMVASSSIWRLSMDGWKEKANSSNPYCNRTEADKLIDDFLPEHEIRLVSVGDSIDTAEGDDEFIFLRNWANEQYARDISKKRRLSNRVRGNAGEALSPPPYGYTKDPENPKRWIVDEEAAAVVRRVYSMTPV